MITKQGNGINALKSNGANRHHERQGSGLMQRPKFCQPAKQIDQLFLSAELVGGFKKSPTINNPLKLKPLS